MCLAWFGAKLRRTLDSSVLWRLRQENCKLEASLGYIEKLSKPNQTNPCT